MVGNFKWNLALGAIGFIATFLVSLPNNPLLTTLLRSCYSGIALIIIAFLVRFILGLVFSPEPSKDNEIDTKDHTTEEKGTNFDVAVDEDLNLNDIMDNSAPTSSHVSSFEPLDPVKLERKIETPEMVDAVRTLSNS